MGGTLQIAGEGLAGYDRVGDLRYAMRPHFEGNLGGAGCRIRGHLANHATARRAPVLVIMRGRTDEPRGEQYRQAQRHKALEPVRRKP